MLTRLIASISRLAASFAGIGDKEAKTINQKLDKIMATEAELNDALDALKEELDAAKARDAAVKAKLDDVSAQLATLIANPAAADFSAELQKVNDDLTEAQSIGQ